jgi:anti-sigma factor RsiW
MNEPRPNDVRPELLAAYLDGELDPPTRRQVEEWLAGHPDAAAEVEGQRRLLRVWHETPPPEPAPARWAALFTTVEAAVADLPRRWPRRGLRGVAWVAAAVTAAAVAAVAGTWMLQITSVPSTQPTPTVVVEEESPLVVVSTDDVEIISMEGEDEDRLLVGTPPVSGPIVLAANGDIALGPIDPNQDGMQGVRMKDGAAGPMLVVPLYAPEPMRED